MRTIIFSSNFPPLINPRSFRVDKLFSSPQKNNTIVVFTSPIRDYNEQNSNVIRCGPGISINPRFRNSLKRYALFRILRRCIWPDDKLIHQFCYLLNYLFKHHNKDDLILTVSNPFSSHIIGLILKIFWNHRWHADIGDIFYFNQHTSILSKWYERKVLQTADLIQLNAVSIRDYFMEQYNLPLDKFSVIPNGIHWDMNKVKHIPSEKLRLSYIGNTYQHTREAIDEINFLIDFANQYPELNILIQLFGNQFYKIEDIVKQYPQLITIAYCDSENEIANAYSNTDVLINFANKDYPGLPSKLEEYVASDLPVLNFYYSMDDPSVLYLRKYYSRFLSVDVNNANGKELSSFIEQQIRDLN